MGSVFSGRAPKFAFLVSGVFLLAGCEASFNGRPASVLDPARPSLEFLVLDKTLKADSINSYLDKPTTEGRDKIIFARIHEIDILYNNFETQLLTESRKSGFLASFAGAAAGLAGANVSAAASQNYSILSGGISALRTSYEKEVLAERTINALTAQMRASRAEVAASIYVKMKSEVGSYPLQAAMSDLEEYEQAGTLATALVGVTKAAVDRAEESEAKAEAKLSTFITGVERKKPGSNITQDSLNTTFQEQARIVADRVKAGKVSKTKIATFLNNPNTSDVSYNNDFVPIAGAIKAVSGQSNVRPEDLTQIQLDSFAVVVASAPTKKAFEDIKAKLGI